MPIVEMAMPDPPDGYEYTGEYRRAHDEPYAWGGKCFVGTLSIERPILRQVVSSYTNVVKASGWRWPEGLHPDYEYIASDEYEWHRLNFKPVFKGRRWVSPVSGEHVDRSCDGVRIFFPDEFGYPPEERLLHRSDFIKD